MTASRATRTLDAGELTDEEVAEAEETEAEAEETLEEAVTSAIYAGARRATELCTADDVYLGNSRS